MKLNLSSAPKWVRLGFVSPDAADVPNPSRRGPSERPTQTSRKTSTKSGSFRNFPIHPFSPLRNGFVSSNCIRLLLIAAAAASLAAQDDPGRRVDEIFRQWDKPATPGASVAIVQSGKS
jgi:CubicO group peptidase (beta-lactamase class C family)